MLFQNSEIEFLKINQDFGRVKKHIFEKNVK